MSTQKHTPGPWFVSASGPVVYSLNDEQPPVNRFSALVDSGWVDKTRRAPSSELMANARLIAAAPDLLEALQAITEASDSYAASGGEMFWAETVSPFVEKAKAVVAKATGGAA